MRRPRSSRGGQGQPEAAPFIYETIVPHKELVDYCAGKRIVLVGNAGSLLKQGLGERIDGHDIVVRMNHGVPRHDEFHNTGRRTDIWVFGFNSVEFQPVRLSQFNPRYVMRLNVPWKIHHALHDRLYCGSRADHDRVTKAVGAKPTTGCRAVDWFVRYSEAAEIHLVGFDFFASGSWLNNIDLTRKLAGWGHDSKADETYIRSLLSDTAKLLGGD